MLLNLNKICFNCRLHYKEYLVSEINKHSIDPVSIMTLDELQVVLQRQSKEPCKRQGQECDKKYANKLIEVSLGICTEYQGWAWNSGSMSHQ